jgi:DNA-directed RNA polymerase subunit RPC12/RpoP
MGYTVINSYNTYIDAHIAKGVLEEHGISSWMKDEHTLTIDPILTNAVGGIKLMVITEEAQRAMEILTGLKNEQEAIKCPKCNSANTELVTTPRKASNWFTAIFGFLLGNYAVGIKKMHHCFDCGHEFQLTQSQERV